MKGLLEGIYRRHRQGLFTLALSITRCPAGAEDAVQEAFARLWGSSSRPAGDEVAYVFAAVRNAAIDQVRGRAGTNGLAASIFDGEAAAPATAAEDAERRRLVAEAVDDLPDPQREAVVLRVYAGLTFAQMAETLGEPLATVASRYRRALEKLESKVRRLL